MGLVCVSVSILVSVTHIQLLFPILQPFRLGILSMLGSAVAVFVAKEPSRTSQGVVPRRHFTALLLLYGWMFVSGLFALHKGFALETVTGTAFGIVVMYLLLVLTLRSPKDLDRLVLVYLVGVILYAVVGIRNMDADAWRLVAVAGYYDGNDFAALCVTGVPLALHFAVKGRTLVRLMSIAGLLVITIGIVYSGSRGGFLALGVVGIFILLRYAAVKAVWRASGLIFLTAVVMLSGGDEFWNRMATILEPEEDYNTTAEMGRVQIWQRGLGYAAERPIAGVGPNNFRFAEGTLNPSVRQGEAVMWMAPHNTYLQVLVDLGIVGFAMFMWLLIESWRGLRRADFAAANSYDRSLYQAIAAALLGLLAATFFLSHAYNPMLFGMLALAAGAAKFSVQKRVKLGRVPRYGDTRLAPLDTFRLP